MTKQMYKEETPHENDVNVSHKFQYEIKTMTKKDSPFLQLVEVSNLKPTMESELIGTSIFTSYQQHIRESPRKKCASFKLNYGSKFFFIHFKRISGKKCTNRKC